jgi:broad specificity phosphatase PhoE
VALDGGPGLTASGREQAAITADWLVENSSVSRIVSSPMRRAVETAAPLGAASGVKLTTDDRLRERMHWNDSAGMSLDDFLADNT